MENFRAEFLKEPKNREKVKIILENLVCNNCLGRQFGMIGHKLSNYERGRAIRELAKEFVDKSRLQEPDVCNLCNNFFKDGINRVAKNVVNKLRQIEFDTFLVGSIPSDEMSKAEERLWEKIGIENVESIKSEINREVGKKIEKLTKRRFDLKNPDITIIADLKTDKIVIDIRSLYVFGKYQKLVRGIPQAKWVCLRCHGKGCPYCKGEGKLYPTSVQEIIEKPLLKATKSKKSKFSAHGREDIDARCLDYRPFVVELVRPLRRKIDLKKIEKQINKSKKVKVMGLKLTTKDMINRLKFAKIDKTYLATVKFEKNIDRKKLRELKNLTKEPILQKTPLRVVHRRADKFRRRMVKKISWKLLGKKKLQLKITGETGLYIKELITGDEGRTEPNVSEMLNNKVKKVELDVVKIHSKSLKL
jgi:tRNA pseudouridine synthase 10